MNGTMFDLTGKVALVTGGGLGIGRAIAAGLAANGADVLICDLNQTDLDEASVQIAGSGRKVLTTIANIGSEADILAMFDLLDHEFGDIHILVNNVGTGARFRPEDLPMERFREVLDIGLYGTFTCSQQAAKRMIAKGHGGSVINISSIAGALALGRGNMAHSVNKGAINSMTREMAVEWAHYGIRVNAILPCQVLTEGFQKWLDSPTFDPELMNRFLTGIPMNRLATPEDMAGPAVFLASDAAGMVTGTLLGRGRWQSGAQCRWESYMDDCLSTVHMAITLEFGRRRTRQIRMVGIGIVFDPTAMLSKRRWRHKSRRTNVTDKFETKFGRSLRSRQTGEPSSRVQRRQEQQRQLHCQRLQHWRHRRRAHTKWSVYPERPGRDHVRHLVLERRGPQPGLA